jgi:undecaprenol kinase
MSPADKNQAFAKRLGFAVTGFIHALRAERSLRTQLGLLAALAAVLMYLKPAAVWWGLIILGSACVLAAELFNTAIEQLADHVHPDLHPQIRIVKDCAAAAVLCAVLGALGIGIAFAVELAAHWR